MNRYWLGLSALFLVRDSGGSAFWEKITSYAKGCYVKGYCAKNCHVNELDC